MARVNFIGKRDIKASTPPSIPSCLGLRLQPRPGEGRRRQRDRNDELQCFEEERLKDGATPSRHEWGSCTSKLGAGPSLRARTQELKAVHEARDARAVKSKGEELQAWQLMNNNGATSEPSYVKRDTRDCRLTVTDMYFTSTTAGTRRYKPRRHQPFVKTSKTTSLALRRHQHGTYHEAEQGWTASATSVRHASLTPTFYHVGKDLVKPEKDCIQLRQLQPDKPREER